VPTNLPIKRDIEGLPYLLITMARQGPTYLTVIMARDMPQWLPIIMAI
jgi:hypothetical protein